MARRAVRRWWWSRLPRSDNWTLTQRNIYILPTRAGWMYALTLLILLVSSINYQLNLGYLLTFLLAGSAVVGMHVTHNTLRGLILSLRATQPVFAGSDAWLDIELRHGRATPRHGIALAVAPDGPLSYTDVPAGGTAHVRISFVARPRGWQEVPGLLVQTHFPLGIFRAWSNWRVARHVLVYPQPEPSPPPLPHARPMHGGEQALHTQADGGEVEGVRAYRRGDPTKLVVWKKSAKTHDMVSRDTTSLRELELWLDWHSLPGLDEEARLSRLCAWVLEAHRRTMRYGLRLGQHVVAADEGAAHQARCLEALALWPSPLSTSAQGSGRKATFSAVSGPQGGDTPAAPVSQPVSAPAADRQAARSRP